MSAETTATVAIGTKQLLEEAGELASRLQGVFLDYFQERGELKAPVAIAALRLVRNYGLRRNRCDLGDVAAIESVVDEIYLGSNL